MQTTLHDLIIRRLSKWEDEDDLIHLICNRENVDWNAGKALLEQIKREHEEDILSRQIFLRTVLAVGTLIAGVTLLTVSILFTVDFITLVSSFLAGRAMDPGQLTILKDSGWTFIELVMQESQYVIPGVILGVVNGLGMIFGSLLGMRETWGWMIERISSLIWK